MKKLFNFILITSLVLNLCGCETNTNKWVKIKNPGVLFNECKTLIDRKNKGEIENFYDMGYADANKDAWNPSTYISSIEFAYLKKEFMPESIKKLTVNMSPQHERLSVQVRYDCVYIMLSTGGIGPCYGYLVSLKEIPDVPFGNKQWKKNEIGIMLSKTEYSNIYKWYAPEY